MALLLTYSFSSVARAEFILGNDLAANNDGQIYTLDSTIHYGMGITVGSNPLFLSDLTLRLAARNNPVIASIDLRTDPDTVGTALGSVNVSGIGIKNYLFNLAPVQLEANTTYWLNVTTNLTGNGDGLFLAANDPAQTPGGSALASYVGLRSGLVGQASTLLPLPAPTMTINGITAVPEPTSLGIVGLIAAAGWRRAMRSVKRCRES